MPDQITIEFEIDKDTPNTIRYKAVAEGQPPVVPTVYVQKWWLGKTPPQKITMTITKG